MKYHLDKELKARQERAVKLGEDPCLYLGVDVIRVVFHTPNSRVSGDVYTSGQLLHRRHFPNISNPHLEEQCSLECPFSR